MSAPVRADLVALTPDKLVALSNKGLVKRALKILDREEGPTIAVEADGTVVATAGDVVTRLEPGKPLRDTSCTCGATAVCRHRVTAVLAYRAQSGGDTVENEPVRWSPGGLSDEALEKLVGKRGYGRAKRTRGKGYVAEVRRSGRGDDIPTVGLPTCTVRFLVPNDLAYARCDCEVTAACEHVPLAVWAFRRADERDPDADHLTVEIAGERTAKVGTDPLGAALELAAELLLDGVVSAGPSLAVRFARAQRPLDEAGYIWPASIVSDLHDTLEAYTRRSASYRAGRLADLITELCARERSARNGGEMPTRVVLGVGEPPETKLDHLRLVSLGARLEEDGFDRSADVFLADPDTAMVLVLRKVWSVGGEEKEDGPRIVGEELARRNIISGVRLGTMARGQVVTNVARRAANRSLKLGRASIARTSVTPQRGEWDSFPEPLLIRDYGAFAETLKRRPPRILRPRHLAEHVHAVAVGAVGDVFYRSGEQVLWAQILDEHENVIDVVLEHRAAAPGAIDALASALSGEGGEVRFISGELRSHGRKLILEPLAIVNDRMISLDVAPHDESHPLKGETSVRFSDDPLHEHVVAALSALEEGAHHGLRHAPSGWRDRLKRAAKDLRDVGLDVSAARLDRVSDALHEARTTGEPAAERGLTAAWVDASIRMRLTADAA